MIRGIQRGAIEELAGDRGQADIVVGFGDERVEVGVARRIEQAQAREMSTAPKLLRRRGQQDQAGRARGEAFDQRVGRAGRVGRPFEVVRLVDDDDVPLGIDDLRGALRVVGEPADVGDQALLVLERIARGIADLDRFAAFLVEQREREIETAQQFDEPLAGQAGRCQYQHARDAAGGEQAREDQAGLDGLAEADFVGEQRAWRTALRNDVGNAQLMGDQVDARAGEAVGRRAHRVRAARQRLDAEVEAIGRIDTRRKQAFVGARDRLRIVEFGFRQRVLAVVIAEQALCFADALDDEIVLLSGNPLADAELGACERGGMHRVMAQDAGGGEQHLDVAPFDANDSTQPQLGFGVGDPALTGNECHEEQDESGR